MNHLKELDHETGTDAIYNYTPAKPSQSEGTGTGGKI
jgi:hypothetical protein